MAQRRVRTLTAGLLVALCSSAYGIENAGQLPAAAEELLRIYPGSHIHKDQDRVRIIYGVPMTPGLDARDAATNFIRMHGDAFGAGALDVREDWSVPFKDGRFTVFCYQQYISNVPVEYGMLKILVKNDPIPQVVYAAGTLAPAPQAGFANPTIRGEQAMRSVQSMKPWRSVPTWTDPELVVYQGTGDWVAPVLTWKFAGVNENPNAAFHRTFFVDAATGTIVKIREDIDNTDVNGTIQGKGTQGTEPDAPYNPPVLLNIPNMRASISGGSNAYSDVAGNFTIPNSGSSPVTVMCGVNGAGAGQWVNVVPTGVAAITASVPNVTPPGPANLLLNPTPAEQLTAQVNAFVCTTVTHNYFKDRAPSFNRIDLAIPANTGVSGTCNAFYVNNTINFYNAGGGCPNTAYSAVVSHEYGHFIVAHLGPTGAGLPQNAFGEGYGDTNAELIWDDKSLGRGWSGQGTYLRDPIVSNIQYPCSQEIHTCGMVISGVWWRTLTAFQAFYGTQDGLDRTRQLEVNWSLITTGGPDGNNAAGPGTAIEFLTVDDNDGNINNGTPDWFRICPSFAAHSINCPMLTLLDFQYPSGRPASIPAGQPYNLSVVVVPVAGQPQPGAGVLHYRVDTGPWQTSPMVENTQNHYTATFPATPCGHAISYYVSDLTTSSIEVDDPLNAPASTYSTIVGVLATNNYLDASFASMPAGWTTTGLWHTSSSCAPGGTSCSGSSWAYYGQDSSCNYNTGTANQGIMTSPAFSIPVAPGGNATLSYCYALTTENSAGHDLAQVLINNTVVDTAPESASWTMRNVNLAAYQGQTVTLTFKFNTVDGVFNNYRGWQIGHATVSASTVVCGTCYPNCDGSTAQPVLNVNDFICFQSRFAAGDSYANCDGSTTVPVLNVNDFICFQNQFAQGCP